MFDVDGSDLVRREKFVTKREMRELLEEYLLILEKGRKDGAWCRREHVGLVQEHDQFIVTGWKAEHMNTDAGEWIYAVVGTGGFFLLMVCIF